MLPTHGRCLVTGASGFIGRQLCRRLLDQGYHVIGVVRKPADFAGFDGCSFQQACLGTLDGDTDWDQILPGVDLVFHLAASGGGKGAFGDQLDALRQTNVEGTRRLAGACVSHKVRRLVYLSSIKVNGEQTRAGRPWTEMDQPAPVTPYGVSKWEAEQAVWHELAKGEKTEAVIIRPPLVYGPHVPGNFLQLMRLVSKRIPLPFARLTNKRSLIYLGNLLDILCLCIAHPAAAGKTYLVSDGEDVSTDRLVMEIGELMGMPARLFYFPENVMRILAGMLGKSEQAGRLLGSLVIDSRKIRAELNWSPSWSMYQGLMETIAWYQGMERISQGEQE